MEEYLLAQKHIRDYFKSFSTQQWNRVAKATLTLGIQATMRKNPRCLAGDFSCLSLEDLETVVCK